MKAIQATEKIDAQGEYQQRTLMSRGSNTYQKWGGFLGGSVLPHDESWGLEPSPFLEGTSASPKQLEQGLKQALVEAGYDSRDKIIHLVQEVKREIAAERQQQQEQ